MADLDLCYLSATDALTKFRALTLSPVELLDALIERAEAVEPAVNALAYCHFDEARAQAKKAEARYAKTDGRLRRLEGLPLAVKEDTAIKGKRQTVGSLIFENRIAQTTDPLVERLVKAGAIIHAQTTCPEFVWPWTCTSRLHGTTRNPWNRSITSGRLLGRLGGRRGRGHDDAGHGQRQRGLDPHARGDVRHRRLQGALRAQSAKPRAEL